ncbi:hypothetical protein THAOC_12014, partial [Thalassiosira oceanica]
MTPENPDLFQVPEALFQAQNTAQTVSAPSSHAVMNFFSDPAAVFGATTGGVYPARGPFFPEWLAYDTNKTRRAEAPFGPAGDDNGRRYEPPPRDRIGLVTAFMPSRAAPARRAPGYLQR